MCLRRMRHSLITQVVGLPLTRTWVGQRGSCRESGDNRFWPNEAGLQHPTPFT